MTKVREALLQKTVAQIRELFGTPRHAMSVLGLTGVIDYTVFYRGLNGTPIAQDAAYTINRAMARWCEVFLADGWDTALTFRLPPFLKNDEAWRELQPPTWKPPT